MTFEEFQRLAQYISIESQKLILQHITEQLQPLDYIGIFPKSQEESRDLIELMNMLSARIVYSDQDGDTYKFIRKLDIQSGPLDIIKIYKPHYKLPMKGYADYSPIDYQKFKEKYENTDLFSTIIGEGWEMMELHDRQSDVFVYFPNIPLTKDLGM